MEKREKMEKVYHLVEELGLTRKEVAECLLAKNSLARKTILPGMYLYTDDTISSDILPGHQIKAVVGYVQDGVVYAVCLRETNLRWSGDMLKVSMFRGWRDGKYATQKILEAADRENKKAEAAQWCYDYEYDGVKKGEAFLPSLAELLNLFYNKSAINEALEKLDCPLLDDEYVSSIEEDAKFVSAFLMGEDEEDIGCVCRGKFEELNVRPVLKIQL